MKDAETRLTQTGAQTEISAASGGRPWRLPQPKLNMTVAARTVGGRARRPETRPANKE
jgi:hypothetical protein